MENLQANFKWNWENLMRIFTNAKGNFEFVYNTKKYLIPCERRFEINSENIVIGFVSNGCF